MRLVFIPSAELKSASSFLVVVALVYSFPTASTGLGTAGLVGTTCPLHFPELGKSFFISRLVYPSELSSRSSDISFVVDDEPILTYIEPPPISTTLRPPTTSLGFPYA